MTPCTDIGTIDNKECPSLCSTKQLVTPCTDIGTIDNKECPSLCSTKQLVTPCTDIGTIDNKECPSRCCYYCTCCAMPLTPCTDMGTSGKVTVDGIYCFLTLLRTTCQLKPGCCKVEEILTTSPARSTIDNKECSSSVFTERATSILFLKVCSLRQPHRHKAASKSQLCLNCYATFSSVIPLFYLRCCMACCCCCVTAFTPQKPVTADWLENHAAQ